MGSSNANKWLAAWMKSHYADAPRDLCTCFMLRGQTLAVEGGYEALITSDTCMYISSFEKMRKRIIEESTILTFIDTRGTNAHPDVFDANAGWVLLNKRFPQYKGAFLKLNQPIAEKQARYLEALANPNCGWFYRRNANTFSAIPGSPIAYWAANAIGNAFAQGKSLESVMLFKTGMVTGNNDRFLRLWWEVETEEGCFDASCNDEAVASGKRWFPYNKGGEFRRWYGNNDYLINFKNEGYDIFSTAKIDNRAVTNMRPELRFKTTVTWSLISSGTPAFRIKEKGFLYDKAGLSFYPPTMNDAIYALGLCNSTFAIEVLRILASTLNFQLGDIWRIPYFIEQPRFDAVSHSVKNCIAISRVDWDAQETSWDFKRHSLL